MSRNISLKLEVLSSKTNCNLYLAESLISKISSAQKLVNLVFLDNHNLPNQGLLERLDLVYPLCGRATGRNRDVLVVFGTSENNLILVVSRYSTIRISNWFPMTFSQN